MPDYSAPPQPADLQALLQSARLWDASTNLDLEGALAQSLDAWEMATGFRPFLAEYETMRRFTLDGSRALFLEAGLLACDELLIDDVEMEEGADFFLAPDNAPAEKAPFTEVRFTRYRLSAYQGVHITGPWGYGLTLPPLAWSGILGGAALHLAPLLAAARRVAAEDAGESTIKAVSVGPIRTEFAVSGKSDTLSVQADAWAGQFGLYKRFRLMGI